VHGRGWKFWAKILAPLVLSIGGLVTLRFLGPEFINQEDLHAILAPLGKWAPLGFIAFLAVRPVLLLPGQIFTAVGGMVFGTVAATAYSLVGSFFAGALLFFLARKLGTRLMRRLAGKKYEVIRRTAKRHDFQFAFFTCINPLVPTDVMLATAAASGARFWPTVGGVLLGTVPGTLLTAQFGSGLAQGRTIMTVVSAVGLVVSLVAGTYFGRKIYKEVSDAAPEEPAMAPAGSPEEGRASLAAVALPR